VEDKTLTCKDCSSPFAFTVRDQQFYIEKGFENEPQRCRDCRTQRKNTRNSPGSGREQFDAVCARCGVATTVPFKPRGVAQSTAASATHRRAPRQVPANRA